MLESNIYNVICFVNNDQYEQFFLFNELEMGSYVLIRLFPIIRGWCSVLLKPNNLRPGASAGICLSSSVQDEDSIMGWGN